MGFEWKTFGKGVYVDGHEREDVVRYRQEVFIPQWLSAREKCLAYNPERNEWEFPKLRVHSFLPRPMVLVTHDESTFNANDGTRQGWTKIGQQPLRPKGRGRGIMVSAFLSPAGILRVPETYPDERLSSIPDWPHTQTGKPIREAVEYLEYGPDRYWDGDRMVEQTIKVALRIFEIAFPGCQALLAFDNASNHCSFAPDALLASKMNLGPGGKQAFLRDGAHNGLKHKMNFPRDYPWTELRDKPKGIKQVLSERGLWSDYRPDGSRMLLVCPSKEGKSTCSGPLCCARTLMASQPDFQSQKGKLQEEIEARNHTVIFYPKFHCELNFIERFWCSSKYYSREHCSYSLEGLRKTVPEALHSVPSSTIYRYHQRCERYIDAYKSGYSYGTKDFTERTHKSHRKIGARD